MLLKFIVQFIIGIGVGVYGYLIPSYINLGVFQISMNNHSGHLRKVILLFSIIEIPYCFICMSSVQWLMQQQIIMLIIKWLIVVVLFLVAFITWKDAHKKKREINTEDKPMDSQSLNKLIIYAVFNPFQLSAWAIWGAYFIDKTWFDWNFYSILFFSIGASLGVFLILWAYAILGKKLIQFFSEKKHIIDYSVAGIMCLLAIMQVVKNIWM